MQYLYTSTTLNAPTAGLFVPDLRCQIINRITDDLFQIYNRFDVNYTDDTGFTHFHAACYNGRRRVVQQFLECHQDPNCIWTETGATPLHAALFRASRKTAKLLLTYGADPNFADRRTGGTSLHMLTWDGYADDYGAEMFFEYSNDQYKPVQVNALDKWNMTPLEWAVANALPNTAKVFLDNATFGPVVCAKIDTPCSRPRASSKNKCTRTLDKCSGGGSGNGGNSSRSEMKVPTAMLE
uniref:Uncharacterized protein n=1 Tax=Trichogramma kaykai TaxID=54128 RepID=A0ABD2X3B5_9HYME